MRELKNRREAGNLHTALKIGDVVRREASFVREVFLRQLRLPRLAHLAQCLAEYFRLWCTNGSHENIEPRLTRLRRYAIVDML